MNTIWKYELASYTDINTIKMRKDAEILSVQVQGGEVCLWAYLNNLNEDEQRYFRIIGTGHLIPDDFTANFIGTVQLDNLVFHIFEVFEL